MFEGRARLTLLAALALSVLGVLLPSGASALISDYNCVLKPPGQWCDGRANGSFDGLHSWDWNEGVLPSQPQHVVCERMWKPATGDEIPFSQCWYGIVSHYYGSQTCPCIEAEVKHYYPTNLNVTGHSDTDY